jgi:hypothetical protein
MRFPCLEPQPSTYKVCLHYSWIILFVKCEKSKMRTLTLNLLECIMVSLDHLKVGAQSLLYSKGIFFNTSLKAWYKGIFLTTFNWNIVYIVYIHIHQIRKTLVYFWLKISCKQSFCCIGMGSSPLAREFHKEQYDTHHNLPSTFLWDGIAFESHS